MASFTNHSAGARGVNVKPKGDKDGARAQTLWVEPGETLEIGADEEVHGALPDFGKPGDSPSQADELAALRARVAEREGIQAGSTKPALTGKNKDQLLVIASGEGVTKAKDADGAEIDIGTATNPQIMDAITAARG